MQYLHNQWTDFNNSWSCLILTFVRMPRCIMYPLHLSYTTTLPRKTITMKITFFHKWIFGNIQIIMTSLENVTSWVLSCLYFKNLKQQVYPLVNWFQESWVEFPWTINGESRHYVSKDWDIVRSRRNTPRRTGSWTLYEYEWPTNSTDLSPLDYNVWGAMLERYIGDISTQAK